MTTYVLMDGFLLLNRRARRFYLKKNIEEWKQYYVDRVDVINEYDANCIFTKNMPNKVIGLIIPKWMEDLREKSTWEWFWAVCSMVYHSNVTQNALERIFQLPHPEPIYIIHHVHNTLSDSQTVMIASELHDKIKSVNLSRRPRNDPIRITLSEQTSMNL